MFSALWPRKAIKNGLQSKRPNGQCFPGLALRGGNGAMMSTARAKERAFPQAFSIKCGPCVTRAKVRNVQTNSTFLEDTQGRSHMPVCHSCQANSVTAFGAGSGRVASPDALLHPKNDIRRVAIRRSILLPIGLSKSKVADCLQTRNDVSGIE